MNELRRDTDQNKFYKCSKCGRVNHILNTIKINNQYECLWECLPFENSSRGWLLGVKEKGE